MNDAATRPRGNTSSIVTLLAILMVIAVSWRQCWYATPLSDREMESYLSGEGGESRIHKALSQFKERLDQKDDSVAPWFDEVAALASHATPQIRSTAAWAMGGAPEHEAFGPVLETLLNDPEVEVRYNAAVSLGARGNVLARPILRSMLAELAVKSPVAGLLEQPRGQGQSCRYGQILARVKPTEGGAVDVTAPLSGKLARGSARHGKEVAAGDELFQIQPGGGQIENALLALGRIGNAEDIPFIQPITEGRYGVSDSTRALAGRLIETLRAASKD